jgi:flagellar FliL protein
MLKNKKVLIAIVPILLFAGYTMTKHKKVVKMKVEGTIYNMPGSFLLNLSDGRYAKMTVALQLAPGQSDGATAEAASSSESSIGTLPEEAIVREIITNTITGMSAETVISPAGRVKIRKQILAAIKSQTDLKLLNVLVPEFTVQ